MEVLDAQLANQETFLIVYYENDNKIKGNLFLASNDLNELKLSKEDISINNEK